jgi:beta-glucosidase-like glycosyl hydrolase/CubicO group peptidase (beta-lactamase class C family)
MKPVAATLLTLMLCVLFFAQATAQKVNSIQTTSTAEKHWVDSVFQSLSTEERIGQLIMIRAHSDKGEAYAASVAEIVRKYKVGGLCFFQGTPEKQLEYTNTYQSIARIPLLVAIDGEWGLGMRLKESAISFPKQLTLGAIQNNDLLYKMGQEIARQAKRIGLNVNFAPVADINSNARNPVIGYRSFGEDRYNVTVKAYHYMKGMQDNGILACAKHFPGHGDTYQDSHYDLPVVNHPINRLDSVEFYPFRSLINYGIGGVMVAHLQVPALDDREDRPSSLSRNAITHVLRRAMGFEGIIFTDGMEMQGVTEHFSNGIAEAEAILAGNDMICVPPSTANAFEALQRYLREGRITQEQIDASVRRILTYKFRLGLTKYTPKDVVNARKDVNTAQAEALKRELIKNALTMVRNTQRLVPFGRLDTLSFASLSIGADAQTAFQKRLAAYAKMSHYQADKDLSEAQQNGLLAQLSKHKVVIVGLHDMNSSASKNYGISTSSIQFLKKLNAQTRVVLNVFGSPYSLKYFDDFECVLMAYEGEALVQDLSAQALFGAFGLTGRLPVTASERSRFNTGEETQANGRFGYSIPESVGMSSDTLSRIELLAQEAINVNATPGCVVLVAKDGQIIYEKAFGHHTYLRERPTLTSDVFDLASVTKIAATTISMMHFMDERRIDLRKPLSNYLPNLNGTNKAAMVIQDIMAHNAGLLGWLPFYKQTLSHTPDSLNKPSLKYYRTAPDEEFAIPVAGNLFLRKNFIDSIFIQIRQSELRPNSNYRYSDLGFYMLAQMVQYQTGQSFDRYVDSTFYAPLGLQTATFNPWKKFSIDQMPPTEEDRYFRQQRIQGYVHDMGAAMLGGVSGHAGLFSNANDLAVIMQMLLQGGYYGGNRYLETETVQNFITRHPRSIRRGVGFDMYPMGASYPSNMSAQASESTFGHTGFTGTCTWVDPEHNLVYVFLSNRTYPSMHNNRLEKFDTRQRIQGVVYKSIRPKGAGVSSAQ